MTPFRLTLVPMPCVEEAVYSRNLAHGAKLPRVQPGKHTHPVAICGGGPSLAGCLDELREWPGDVWAINYTADYLLERGVDCTFFTVDPSPMRTTAAKRLVATCVDPALAAGDVQCFALCEHEPGGVPGGTTSAGRAATLALRLGYPGAVFYGCDGSFEGADHVDRNEARDEVLIVRANGREFHTYMDLYDQSRGLAHLLTEFPAYFKSRSGGLLDAMAADPDWSVVAVSAAFKAKLIRDNGDSGLYDEPYAPPCKSCGRMRGHYDDCEVGLGVF